MQSRLAGLAARTGLPAQRNMTLRADIKPAPHQDKPDAGGRDKSSTRSRKQLV